MSIERPSYKNLPNLLTVTRVLAIPVVMVLLSFSGPLASLLGALCFAIAGATDILDGFLARRQRSVTPFGKFMDPLADKLLVTAALIMLIRNSLIMFGIDANWYDMFVGLFIIFAVLLERLRARSSG